MVRKVDKQELKAAIERKVAQTYEPVKPAVQLNTSMVKSLSK